MNIGDRVIIVDEMECYDQLLSSGHCKFSEKVPNFVGGALPEKEKEYTITFIDECNWRHVLDGTFIVNARAWGGSTDFKEFVK